MPDALVVAIDLGGTKIAATAVTAAGDTGPVHRTPTPALEGPDSILDAVADLVREVADGRPVSAVGIGSAGAIDPTTGTVVSATQTLPGWAGTNLVAGVGARLSGPGASPLVAVENDVDAHARGEAWRGAAAGAPIAVVVAVGTGVGASVLVDGEPWRGAHHHAGELGHAPVPGADGRECSCGRKGHLEAVAAGPAIHRHYLALGGDPACPDARDVVARSASGETTATEAVVAAGSALGRALAGLVTTLDPNVVVLGGGVAVPGTTWWDAVEGTMRRELVDVLQDVDLRPAVLGPEAALVGAGRLAWSALDAGGAR